MDPVTRGLEDAERDLGRKPSGDDPGYMRAVAELVGQGGVQAGLGDRRAAEVAVDLGHVGVVERPEHGVVEVRVARVDPRVDNRPGDASPRRVERPPRGIRLDRRDRVVDERLDLEVGPDPVDRPRARQHFLVLLEQ